MAAVTGRHWARTLVSASVTPDPGTPEPGHNIPRSSLHSSIHSPSELYFYRTPARMKLCCLYEVAVFILR